MPVLEFDATISLFRHHVVRSPFCDDPEAAVVAVREAVERMPGAFWISVAYVGKGPAYLHDAGSLETLYRRCNANPPDGPEWRELGRQVEAVIAVALNGETRPSSLHEGPAI